MSNLMYRVLIHVGYNDAYFDFDSVQDAADFASTALKHSKGCDDAKAAQCITMEIRESKDANDGLISDEDAKVLEYR